MNYADDQNAKPHVILSLAYDGWMGKLKSTSLLLKQVPNTHG